MIAIDHLGRPRVTARTLLRTGARLVGGGLVVHQASNEVAMARLAVESLLLSLLPTASSRDESRAALQRVLERAAEATGERDEWQVTPLVVSAQTYALWHGHIPEGVVAHADLGWATVAMWSTSPFLEFAWAVEDISDTVDPFALLNPGEVPQP